MTLKASRTSAFLTGVMTVFLLFLVENLMVPTGGSYPLGPAHIILMLAFLIACSLFVFGVEALSATWRQFREQGLFPDWGDQMTLLFDIMPRFLMLLAGGLFMVLCLKLYFMFGMG